MAFHRIYVTSMASTKQWKHSISVLPLAHCLA